MKHEKTGTTSLSRRDFLRLVGTSGLSLSYLSACNLTGVDPESLLSTPTQPTNTAIPSQEAVSTKSVPQTQVVEATNQPVTEYHTSVITELPPDLNNADIRMFTKDGSGNRTILPFGLSLLRDSIADLGSEDLNVEPPKEYLLSGVLGESWIDGEQLYTNYLLPDGNGGEVTLTLKDRTVWREDMSDLTSPPVFILSETPKSPAGGTTLGLHGFRTYLAEDWITRVEPTVGKQSAIRVHVSNSKGDMLAYLQDAYQSFCNGWESCYPRIDEKIEDLDESWEVISALRDGRFRDVDGKTLNAFFDSLEVTGVPVKLK